jgi:hypothetical protein
MKTTQNKPFCLAFFFLIVCAFLFSVDDRDSDRYRETKVNFKTRQAIIPGAQVRVKLEGN